MKHLGDITKINGADVPPVNVIIGGSPCQDLSIAGRRAGLEGERSGLFMDQIRIIKEMREADEKRGREGTDIRPRFMVWENVPGAFSSNKGADFGAVLQETVRIVCEKAPAVPKPAKGWPTAGCLTGMGDRGGGRFSVAWRVFDAQFWGVPQRRRRIALVADFAGYTAPEILFERKSLSGDSPPIRTPWEAIASNSENRIARNDRVLANEREGAVTLKIRSGCDGGGKGALIQHEKSATLSTLQDQTLFQPTYCIQGNCIDRADTAVCNGRGWKEDVSYTLNTVDRPAVVQEMPDAAGFAYKAGAKSQGIGYAQELAPTLSAERHDASIVYDARENGNGRIVSTVTGGHEAHISDYTTLVLQEQAKHEQRSTGDYDMQVAKECYTQDAYDLFSNNTVGAAMRETGGVYGGGGETLVVENIEDLSGLKYIVRRLTPLECERLQGFPDNWTDIGSWEDRKGKRHEESTDSARYKALGNSIALPSWAYVLQKISICCGPDHTMASLFDGIGGFPFIWELYHGKGSCLWASEIEDFPIAVTKRRFLEEAEHEL